MRQHVIITDKSIMKTHRISARAIHGQKGITRQQINIFICA